MAVLVRIFCTLLAAIANGLTDWAAMDVRGVFKALVYVMECDIRLNEHSCASCRCTHSVGPRKFRSSPVSYCLWQALEGRSVQSGSLLTSGLSRVKLSHSVRSYCSRERMLEPHPPTTTHKSRRRMRLPTDGAVRKRRRRRLLGL